jgi:hypothetical protein
MDLFRMMHLGAGGVALGAFLIPIVAKKGGRTHRRAGWVYSIAMWVAALSAWVVCWRRLTDDNPRNDAGALFLVFIGLLSANGALAGIRAVRSKARTAPSRHPLDTGLSALFLFASLGLLWLGIRHASTLFLAFSGLGIFRSVAQLRFWLRPPESKRAWWYEHMANMLVACIATVTAFLVVNVPRLGLKDYALWFWISPGVIGGVGIAVWVRYYRTKFTTTEKPAASTKSA